MDETVVPALQPRFGRPTQHPAPQDVLRAPLLHLVSRPDAWEHWFRAMDIGTKRTPEMFG
jgi:LysR family glycine cleavage system transcriptional activator